MSENNQPNQNPYSFKFPIYSSQSATSTYFECPRRYLYNYRLYGTGIVPNYMNVPLVTGSSVHEGIATICKEYTNPFGKITPVLDIEIAIQVAKEHYNKEVAKNYIDPSKLDTSSEEIYQEQLALIEALIRLWYLKEFPKLIQYYDILAIEQEIAFPLSPNTVYMVKPDLILLGKENGDVVNYSLKTAKMYTDRTDNSLKTTLQVSTEPYGTVIWLKDIRASITSTLENLQSLPKDGFLRSKINGIEKFLKKYEGLPIRPSSTRFCYLIKGEQKKDKEAGPGPDKWLTDSPLLYGWRKFTANRIEYAWSFWTKNPENKSGYGRLGKGWERFKVWEDQEVGGIKGWLEMLDKGEGVEKNIGDGDVLDKYILSTPDVFVSQERMLRRMDQVTEIEREMIIGLDSLQHIAPEANIALQQILDIEFPQNTDSCFFPTKCPYLTICPTGSDFYKEHIANDPLNAEFGELSYRRRVPHHLPELESFQEEKKEKV